MNHELFHYLRAYYIRKRLSRKGKSYIGHRLTQNSDKGTQDFVPMCLCVSGRSGNGISFIILSYLRLIYKSTA